MADVPKDLLQQIERLEELFVVAKEKLIAITDHFVNELAKGLSKEGGSIVSRIYSQCLHGADGLTWNSP